MHDSVSASELEIFAQLMAYVTDAKESLKVAEELLQKLESEELRNKAEKSFDFVV